MSVWISVQSINGFQKFCICLTRQYSWLPQFCIDPNCNSSFPKQLLLPFSSVPNFCCFQLTLCLLRYFLASGMTCYLPLLGHRCTGWVEKDAVIMILVSWTHLQSDPGAKAVPASRWVLSDKCCFSNLVLCTETLFYGDGVSSLWLQEGTV